MSEGETPKKRPFIMERRRMLESVGAGAAAGGVAEVPE
jgi:hypothetical protein